jgi:hypothetical protein
MRNSSRLLLSCALVTIALAAMVHGASARELTFSSQSIRAVWAPVFVIVPMSPIAEFRCLLTLEGSFHGRTIGKAPGNLIGYITRAIVGHPCGGEGEMWVHNGTERVLGGEAPATSLPWHMRYLGFTGTLPAISEVRILLRGIRVTAMWRLFGMEACLAVFGEPNESIITEWKLGPEGRVIAIQLLAQPLRKREVIREFSCQNEIRLNSSATTITPLGGTTPISITLI